LNEALADDTGGAEDPLSTFSPDVSLHVLISVVWDGEFMPHRRAEMFCRGGSGMLRNTRRADTRAAGLRIESVADPDDHFSLGGERKNLGVEKLSRRWRRERGPHRS